MIIQNKRIFFGHQSVGSNILDGINNILTGDENLKLIESRNPGDCTGPCFFHCRIGKNQDPISKINDFKSLMNSGFGNNVDIACFKFCYIDIQESTNVEQLFETYRNELDLLAQKYKNTTFLHITVPLRTVEHGFRRITKKLLGKKSLAVLKNLNRQAFNEMLVRRYRGTGQVLDLARFESTYPGGQRCKTRSNGTEVYSLVPQYTDDGGHLNARGRIFVAKSFLESLEQLSKK